MKDTIRDDAVYQSPDGGWGFWEGYIGGCWDVADASATPTKEDTLVESQFSMFSRIRVHEYPSFRPTSNNAVYPI